MLVNHVTSRTNSNILSSHYQSLFSQHSSLQIWQDLPRLNLSACPKSLNPFSSISLPSPLAAPGQPSQQNPQANLPRSLQTIRPLTRHGPLRAVGGVPMCSHDHVFLQHSWKWALLTPSLKTAHFPSVTLPPMLGGIRLTTDILGT